MGGMEFEYDEEGGTFYYFLTSFWALVLIPVTIYLWPRTKTKDEQERLRRLCNCPPCLVKRQQAQANSSWLKTRETAVKVGIIVGWLVLAILVYKVSMIQMDYEEYDPFTILGIDRGATDREIKRAYRKLSVQFHPDKDKGDAKKFMMIAKAYSALTNEESRKNWEEFGNPDGPGVTRFGIALPKWIIDDDNSLWVLLVYIVIFMVILPTVVGLWWYRSIKFSKDQVLLDTTRLYYYFFQSRPNMILKKVIMVLAGSFEFYKLHNSEIQERASDNEEVPMLMKQLPNLDEKNKEKPLCFGYSVKARALLHAHFARLELPKDTLDLDRIYILKKCPALITEMINIISQLVASAMARQIQCMPRLDMVENCMKLSQLIIQGLETKSSPLQQLPHIRPDMLRHFVTKKRNIQRIRDLINMPEDERRQLLRTLNDNEYQNVMNVCATMPNVEMTIKSEVLDDDDSTITAGSIVTVTVTLKRRNLMDNFDMHGLTGDTDVQEVVEEEEEEREPEDDGDDNKLIEATNTAESKHKAWQKQAKGKKKGGKAKAKKAKQPYQWKKSVQTVGPISEETNNANVSEAANEGEAGNSDNSENEDVDNQSSDEETPAPEKKVEKVEKVEKVAKVSRTRKTSEKDDDDWDKFQEESKKENSFEAKIKESHPVHCPHFPDEKQEGWWLYAADKKKRMLVSAPIQILSLKTQEEMQLKFSAPPKTGIYTYSISLKSDSYVDIDQVHNIKLDVKEAKVVEDHPQWDISSDEEDKGPNEDEASEDSDYSTDGDESDY